MKTLPANTYSQIRQDIKAITTSAQATLAQEMDRLLDKLTEEEILKFTKDGAFPVRLAKTLLVAIAEGGIISREYATEATLKEIKALKRINHNRYHISQ